MNNEGWDGRGMHHALKNETSVYNISVGKTGGESTWETCE
jgi:hypothetical protein